MSLRNKSRGVDMKMTGEWRVIDGKRVWYVTIVPEED